jgi:D-alanyl-D-alanine carboxypeptidase/D-alanyl-D-alanine-endopeptidase (penicillin-binding protein 4)
MKKIVFKIVVSIVFFLTCGILESQVSFQKSIDNWIKHDYLKFSQIGIAVYDINNNTYLGGVNHQKSLIPASSLKIIPTLLIQEKLGANYTYSTKIAYTGTISKDGILNGNLYIIGAGDPSLGSNRFVGYADKDSLLNLITHKIANNGINCIDGNLYLVPSIYDNNNVANTWQWNDISNYYTTIKINSPFYGIPI